MNAIVISISSDIGSAVATHLADEGWNVSGTYRTESDQLSALRARGIRTVSCDLNDSESVRRSSNQLPTNWDALIVCPGTQDPIGLFADCDFDEWAASINVNFVQQMRFIHALLPTRNRHHPLGSSVITWAGGATNNATERYSAYTISKIAQIKMAELLDFEHGDVRFTIIGPGWVKTKIHQATIEAGSRAGTNLARTVQKLGSSDCTTMADVVGCCDWVLAMPREVIGGRNISAAFDQWGSDELSQSLSADPDMYKLRRNGNNRIPPR